MFRMGTIIAGFRNPVCTSVRSERASSCASGRYARLPGSPDGEGSLLPIFLGEQV